MPHPMVIGTVIAHCSMRIAGLGAGGWYPIFAKVFVPKWVEPSLAKHSIELMATQVMPRLN